MVFSPLSRDLVHARGKAALQLWMLCDELVLLDILVLHIHNIYIYTYYIALSSVLTTAIIACLALHKILVTNILERRCDELKNSRGG